MTSIAYQPMKYAPNFSSVVASGSKYPALGRVSTNSFAALSWNWDLLTLRFGDKRVRPLIDIPGSGKFDTDYRNYEKDMLFRDFIAHVKSKPAKPCYLAYLRPAEIHSDLHADAYFGFLKIPFSSDTDTRIWMGSQGTNSGPHSDLKDNIFIQVAGKKLLYLAAPEQTTYVYPQIDNIVNSDVQFPDPDLKKYPNLQYANLQKHVVSPGDAVFIPRGWWHCLVSLENSISVNHLYGPPISNATYIKLIRDQGWKYTARMLLDLIKYGVLKALPKNDFFFTPPPNGARLYSYLRHGNFSLENDPVTNK